MITMHKGFQMTFENELTIILRDNKRSLRDLFRTKDYHNIVEVMVVYKGKHVDISEFVPEHCLCGGTVCNRMSPEDALYVMNEVAAAYVNEQNYESEV